MAYTKILPISSGSQHVKTAIHYAVREDKATERINAQHGVLLASMQHVTCPEWAADEFEMTREFFGKPGGRLAYQVIQSFSPKETGLTPQQVHAIGVELAATLFGDHEAVIGTHVDRDHIHNHIIVNSVSAKDGHKIHIENGWIENVLERTSNAIAKKHGATIDTKRKDPLLQSPAARRFKEGTYKETIRRDMACALRRGADTKQVLGFLQQCGYNIDTTGPKPKVRPPGANNYFRLDRIYEEREYDEVFFSQPQTAADDVPDAPVSPMQEQIFAYVQILLGQEQHRNPKIPFDEYRFAAKRKKQYRFLVDHDITTPPQLDAALKESEASLSQIRGEGRKLSREKRSLAPLCEAAMACEEAKGQSAPPLSVLAQQRQLLAQCGLSSMQIRARMEELERRTNANKKQRVEAFEGVTALREAVKMLSSSTEFARAQAEPRRTYSHTQDDRAQKEYAQEQHTAAPIERRMHDER